MPQANYHYQQKLPFVGSATGAVVSPALSSRPQVIPLDSRPNQSWSVTVQVDGAVQTFAVKLRYNEIAQYWVMTLYDSRGNLLLDSIPLLSGLNILNPSSFMGIGSIYILNVSGSKDDRPNHKNLGSDFQMMG